MESAEAEGATASADEGEVNGSSAPTDADMAVEAAPPVEEEKSAPSEDAAKAAPAAAEPAAAPAAASLPDTEENGLDESKPAEADASNGSVTTPAVGGQGNGGAVEKEGGENGEITLENVDGQSKDTAAAAGAAGSGEEKAKIDAAAPSPTVKEAAMEVEPAPKEDVVVDYTDEFGRVRQMLQR